jgi:hypothetical protein
MPPGLTYGEQVTTLTTETMHKWVHQADQDPKVLLQGDVAGFTAASGRIAVDHWSALLSCTLEFQKAFLAALPSAAACGQEKPDRNVITGSCPDGSRSTNWPCRTRTGISNCLNTFLEKLS